MINWTNKIIESNDIFRNLIVVNWTEIIVKQWKC